MNHLVKQEFLSQENLNRIINFSSLELFSYYFIEHRLNVLCTQKQVSSVKLLLGNNFKITPQLNTYKLYHYNPLLNLVNCKAYLTWT